MRFEHAGTSLHVLLSVSVAKNQIGIFAHKLLHAHARKQSLELGHRKFSMLPYAASLTKEVRDVSGGNSCPPLGGKWVVKPCLETEGLGSLVENNHPIVSPEVGVKFLGIAWNVAFSAPLSGEMRFEQS